MIHGSSRTLQVRALRTLATAALVLAAACKTQEAQLTPEHLTAADRSPEGVALRVKLGGLYYVGSEAAPTRAAQLDERIRGESARRAAPPVLYVFADPGVVGYDVVLAVNAARRAGIREVHGIAGYTDDQSPAARAGWKKWSMDLTRDDVDAPPLPDTLPHG